MKQWIIDRYNKGQDEYEASNGIDELLVGNTCSQDRHKTELYDFLYNPKWGFAKAFWGDRQVKVDSVHFDDDDECSTDIHENLWKVKIQQMATAPDPLQYLEKFKELKNERKKKCFK